MSPEQRFARWVKGAVAAFILLFVYFLIADSFMPITPEARVMRPVTRIAPELSAPVKEVMVDDHQQVAKGDGLFRLDPASFQLDFVRKSRHAGNDLCKPLPACCTEFLVAHALTRCGRLKEIAVIFQIPTMLMTAPRTK
ncbi:Biotin-lipoyl like [Vreelandella subterranea]|uniref:Biotin-lipoyl like n=1 Tax=Vreelandella subterranea TaxID=416874 RepID=A0A1H9T924_9GAMM|nr:Biotin-lipoyl like [Halomonas subterranea]